ncbi:gliding motility-associated C-terminal domain-containing protein [Galbibacter sp. EGI 63066]|uniref:T9SS type B sorting domain-containing protein n=1 Tax=Galbibacter sp. EGI 63066 TaxID=2993559 RepID=UPI002248838A|nr:gliding motility-associated C-terminal domain-containing protein [Galbibacter sp. EGI 63066]MCX2679281.1 gliding motility-associated C-terminal domain-containing protein [Galbibacter sp. EGI 63066]
MKTKLLLLLLFGCFMSIQAQTTAISDNNFEQFLVDQGIDTDGTVNGTISNANAQSVTQLILDRNDITDFTGLEAFTNLTILNLSRNQFATIPTGALTALEELTFLGNNSLTSLDLSANTALTKLNITGTYSAPPITALDLSNNISLTDIRIIDFGNLSSLTFPTTTDQITSISLGDLKLTEIDLTNMSGLQNFTLDDNEGSVTLTLPAVKDKLKNLRIQSIGIDVVDVSQYVALEQLFLRYTGVQNLKLPATETLKRIDIYSHKLTGITSFENASQLENLTVEWARDETPLNIDISQNTALKTLELNNNYMPSLDITNNTNLTSADLAYNNLTSLDVTQNTSLTRLEVQSNKLTAIDVTNNTLLRDLKLQYNQISAIDISKNINLTDLNLSNNNISILDVTQNTKLDYLSVGYNQLTELDISKCIGLEDLYANDNQLSGNSILEQYHIIRTNDSGLGWYNNLNVSNNNLSGTVPDFSTLVDGNAFGFKLAIEENSFEFGDLEGVHDAFVELSNTPRYPESLTMIFSSYTYAPQAKVDEEGDIIVRDAGEAIILTTTVSGEQNHYQWYKDGEPIPDAPDSPNYELTSASTCDTGVYYCIVTSDLVPFENEDPPGTDGKNLELERHRIVLGVNMAIMECVSLTAPLDGDVDVPTDTAIEWSDDPGACGYKINVGTTPGGTDIVNNEDVGNTTVYNFEENLPENTRIYVNITPYDGGTDHTGCTEESFTTYNIPECTSLVESVGPSEIEWEAVSTAEGYYLTIGTTSGGIDLVNNEDVGDVTTYTLATIPPEGTVLYVNITPYNHAGNATGCAEETFTILAIPECASLTAPLDSATDIPINTNLEWDAVTGAEGYRLTVGTTSGGNELVNNQDLGNVTTYSFTEALPGDAIIYISITAYNDSGDAVGCTEESFTTLPVPECVLLTTPLNNATDVSVNTDLEWAIATGADGYRLTAGMTSGGNDLVDNQDLGNVTTYSFTNALPEGTTVYVSVTAYNESGDATGCLKESFTTLAVPECASLTAPLDGASDVSVDTGLEWEPITGADGYRLTVGTISGGNDLVDNQDLGNVTTYNFTEALADGITVYANITAYNESGDAVGCAEESFTTLGVPECTSLSVPTDGDIEVSINTNLIWATSSSATGYRLSVGTTSGGTDIVNNEDVGNVTDYAFANVLPKDTQVFVNITPYNSAGDATACTEASFTTEKTITAPSCTTLTQPLDGATDITINTDLQWETITSATGYRLSVGTTSRGTDIIDNLDVGSLTTLPVQLPEETEIFVNITPYNSAGDATACTEVSFTTERITAAPECTSLSLPIDGDTEISVNTNLIWATSSSATGYQLSVGTTSGGTDIINNLDVGNVTDYSFTNPLPKETDIYVNITPYNSVGDATACTEAHFTTEKTITAPSCTALAQPLDGATDVTINTNLQWATIASATGYRLSVGTTSEGTDIINNLDIGDLTTFPVQLPEETEIFVNITPYNSAGDAIACTEASFTTEKLTEAPECTTLIQPLDGDTDVAINTDIEWETSSSATGYRLSVGTSSGGTDIVDDLDVGDLTYYSFTNPLPEETTIYVNITPYNSVGDATACTETSFTTEKVIDTLECVTFLQPLDGATDVAIDIELQWTASEGADDYLLLVGTTPGGIDLVNTLIEEETFTLTEPLPEETTIYVSITPRQRSPEDEESSRGCTTEISFTTEKLITIPDCTSLKVPNNTIDIAVDTQLEWGDTSSAEGYRLTVGTEPGRGDIVEDLDVGNITSYTFSEPLPENTQIYVQVIPYNSAGDASGCNEYSFRTTTSNPIANTSKYGISPNGDGINDFWEIPGIEEYPDNEVSVFNRWGDKIFEVKGYDNYTNVFNGTANQLKGLGADKLPNGTYFYTIRINEPHNHNNLQGFIVLKR